VLSYALTIINHALRKLVTSYDKSIHSWICSKNFLSRNLYQVNYWLSLGGAGQKSAGSLIVRGFREINLAGTAIINTALQRGASARASDHSRFGGFQGDRKACSHLTEFPPTSICLESAN